MQRRVRWRALSASLVLAMTAGSGAALTSGGPAAAQTTTSAAVVNVPPGMAPLMTPGYHRLPTVSAPVGDNTGFTVTVSDGTLTYDLAVAPNTTTGTIAVAPPATFSNNTLATATATNPKLTVTEQGKTACDTPEGEFTISDIAFGGTAGAVSRLAMTFRVACATLTNRPITSGYVYFAEPDGPIGTPVVGEFYPMTPKRLLDTRDSGALGPDGTAAVQVAGGSSTVPANAIAVVLNITAVSPSQQTFLTAYPTGSGRPDASNVNPVKDDIVPNLATVKVGTGGSVTLYNNVGTTNALVDVMGYYLPDEGGAAGARFTGQTPVRALDSRNGSPFGPGETRSLSVDATATAAVLNVTVDQPTTDTYLTVFPGGASGPPTASNLNVKAGQDPIANLVVVQLDSGAAKIYNAAGNAHVIVDVVGVFKAATGLETAGRFVPVTPVRAYDTRNSASQGSEVTTPIGAAAVRDVGLLGLLGAYPFEYQGVTANLTVTNTTASGYLTAYPAGTPTPFASSLNWRAGETRPNLTMIGTDGFGFNSFYNAAGQTDLVIDVAGWFTR